MLIPFLLTSLLTLAGAAEHPGSCTSHVAPPKLKFSTERKPASWNGRGELRSYVNGQLCHGLRPGEFRVWSEEDYGDIWRASGETRFFYLRPPYTIQRTGESAWKAIIAVDFIATPGVDMTPGQMRRRVNTCLGQFNPHLKGPNGEQLEIVVTDSSGNGLDPRLVPPAAKDISFLAAGARSNSQAYAADIDCPTILHELLHLLGLSDEYKETAEHRYDSTCRTQHGERSVMSSQWEVYEPLLGKIGECDYSAYPRIRNFLINPRLTPQMRRVIQRESPAWMGMTLVTEPTRQWLDIEKERWCRRGQGSPYGGQRPTESEIVTYTHSADSLNVRYLEVGEGPSGPMLWSRSLDCSCQGQADCRAYLARFRDELETSITQRNPGCHASGRQVGNIGQDIPPGGSSYDPNTGRLVYRTRPTQNGGSLLRASHFERIIAGPCWYRAEKYNECSRFAYPIPPGIDQRLVRSLSCQNVPRLKTAVLEEPIRCNSAEDVLGSQLPSWRRLREALGRARGRPSR